jgi:hypothetical protein
MATEKLKKLTTKLKTKNMTNSKIKNDKDSHELRLTRTHIFKILWRKLCIFMGSSVYKPRNITVLFSQC